MSICVKEVVDDGITTRTMMSTPDGFVEFTGAIKYSNEYDDPRMYVECVIEKEATTLTRPWYLLWFPRTIHTTVRVTRWRRDYDFNIHTETIVNC